MKQKVLLLEDDRILSQSIKELLESDSFVVDLAVDGEEAAELTYENKYDLYLLDINVPKIDGLELLESLRDASDNTPTIFISAMVDIKTMTKGFNLGADDYIKKPFDPEELLLRISSKIKKSVDVITYNDLVYNPATKELRKDGHLITLSSMLLDMLHILITSKNQVVDKIALEECMQNPSAQALRVAVNKLKKTTGLPIKNIRGVGYIVESD
ncbi:MAG: response regulator transcription factor [Campylobacterales bacterium]